MSTRNNPFIGQWRIVWMETWEPEDFDAEGPAHITVGRDLTGDFRFGTLSGEIDGRLEKADGEPRLAFSWAGFAENDAVSGRGWLTVQGDRAEGRIFIHLCDESAFRAERR